MSERFDRAIKALVNAFFNETLAPGSCACCAVGNIIAASIKCIPHVNNGLSIWVNEQDRIVTPRWQEVFLTVYNLQELCPENYKGVAQKQIESTGYSYVELAMVEKAFEYACSINYDDYDKFSKEQVAEDQYNGLMAVVDVLCDIEGIKEVESIKNLFKNETVLASNN